MKLTDFYNEIARLADTDKTQINVADTKRVMACAFDVLAKMDANEALDTVAKGVATASKRAAK